MPPVTQAAPELLARREPTAAQVEELAAPEERLPGWALAAAAALVLAGVALRLHTTSPLWLDEALSANIASLPVTDLLDALRRDGHPPLYYLLLHGWTALVGDGDAAVRALSTVFALATIPLLWVAARRLGGRWCAIATTVLYATSPFAIRYATETRMYSLVAFLVVAGWLALRRAEARPRPARLLLVSLVAGALLLTHYWSLFLLAAVVGLHVLRAWRARRAGREAAASLRLAVAVAAGALLFVPWLPSFLTQASSTGTPWATPTRPLPALFLSLADWGGGPQGEAMFLGLSLLLLALLALLGRPIGRGRIELVLGTRPGARAEWAVVSTTMALAVGISFLSGSAFTGRYTAVIHPLVVLLAGFGVLVLPTGVQRLAVLGVLGLVGIGFGAVSAVTDRSQAGQLADAIQAGAGPEDLVVYCPDQLGPSTSRLLDGSPPGITFPDAGDPRFVDWVDYRAGLAAADPAAFARAAAERAGPGDIWLVWSSGYLGLAGVCERVVDELAVLRPGRSVVVQSGTQLEHAWLYRYAAP